jgi:hypothetical protein
MRMDDHTRTSRGDTNEEDGVFRYLRTRRHRRARRHELRARTGRRGDSAYQDSQAPDTPEVTCEAKNPAPTQTVELPEDARAIDFGPWVNSFMAEVKRNCFVPYRAMTMKGCAVITVLFHKDGSHENPIVKNPSVSSDYTRAAYNAIVAVSRMAPLPAQYQKDSLEFTITISYDPRDAETLLNQNAKPAK